MSKTLLVTMLWGGWLAACLIDGLSDGRSVLVASLLALYLARTSVAVVVLLRRPVPWTEAVSVGVWTTALMVVLVWSADSDSMSAWTWVGVGVYAAGLIAHPWAEVHRHIWKRRPEAKGHLFTGGLFGIVRHPNYASDLLLFGGLAAMTGTALAWIVPIAMLLMFVYVHIPRMTVQLRRSYGEEFATYERETARLIPYLY